MMTMVTPLVETEKPLPQISFCTVCKRWEMNTGGSPERCPTCDGLFDIRYELHQELLQQYAELVVALQDVVHWRDFKDTRETAMALEPTLWGADPKGIVKFAVNPLFWANMTWPKIRLALNLLTSAAGYAGVGISLSKDGMGREVTMLYEGERWLFWEDAKTGSLTKVRPVAMPNPQEELLAPSPSLDKRPEGVRTRASLLQCVLCGKHFKKAVGLRIHRTQVHRQVAV